jgi:hypothetical protein
MQPMGRNQGPRPKPVPVVTDLEERRQLKALEATATPTATLEDERDRVDQAWEAWTMPQQSTQLEARQLVARHVDEAKSSLLAAGQLCADREDLISVHARVASVALEVDTLLSDLAGGGEAA